jgi:hypothetical protein
MLGVQAVHDCYDAPPEEERFVWVMPACHRRAALINSQGLTHVLHAGAPELPPHKFGAHDVVALRPNKGPSEGPPLCTGE